MDLTVDLTEVVRGLRFPEGPIAMPDGSVLVTEIAGGTIVQVTPDGGVEVVAEPGGGPNGLAIGPDGACYVCNNGGYFDYREQGGVVVPHAGSEHWQMGSIQRVDLSNGEVELLYDACDGVHLLAPNDIVFDAAGGFWFTDHGVRSDDAEPGPSVLYAAADGSSIVAVVGGLDATNGVGLSPDGSTLHVAETYTGRLLSWPVTGPGALDTSGDGPGGSTISDDRAGTALYDSLAVDSEGGVCVATLLTGGVTIVRPDTTHFVPTGDPLTTNICFGGDDLRTAWITLSGTGRLVRAEWPVPGLQPAYR